MLRNFAARWRAWRRRRAVAWRLAALLPLIPTSGPLRTLPEIVRPYRDRPAWICLQCGAALPEDRRYRCGLCSEASILAHAIVREGVGATEDAERAGSGML